MRTPDGETNPEHVVLAVPPPLAAETIGFTPDLQDCARRVPARTAVWMGDKAVAIYDEPFWRAQALFGSAISHAGPVREFHDHSGPDGTPAAIFGFATPAGLAPQQEHGTAAAFGAQLVGLFGAEASNSTTILAANWNSEPPPSQRSPSTPERAHTATMPSNTTSANKTRTLNPSIETAHEGNERSRYSACC